MFMPIGKWCNLATGCNIAIDCHHWSYSKFMYYSLNLWSTLDFNFIMFIINVLSLQFVKCPHILCSEGPLSPLAGNLGRTLQLCHKTALPGNETVMAVNFNTFLTFWVGVSRFTGASWCTDIRRPRYISVHWHKCIAIHWPEQQCKSKKKSSNLYWLATDVDKFCAQCNIMETYHSCFPSMIFHTTCILLYLPTHMMW